MDIYEMRRAVNSAKRTLADADEVSNEMARSLVDRLRTINSTYVLKKMKRELQNFNARTGEWK